MTSEDWPSSWDSSKSVTARNFRTSFFRGEAFDEANELLMRHLQFAYARLPKVDGLALFLKKERTEHVASDIRDTSIFEWNIILDLKFCGVGVHGLHNIDKLGVLAQS